MQKALPQWLRAMCTFFFITWFILGLAYGQAYSQTSSQMEDSTAAKQAFQGLDRSYTPAPLWTWNDLMSEEGVRRHLGELAEQGVRQVFVHPRPGLMTSYLTDDWFRLFDASLKAAEELDMNVWIYDENSYPSGFAGGLVTEAMPEAREQGFSLLREKRRPELNGDVIAVYLLKDGHPELVTELVKKKATPDQGDYVVARRIWGTSKAWYAGQYYVDLLKSGVTEKFLDITLGAYKKHFGDQFGKRIPGSFTDEPRLSHEGQFHWNDELPTLFEKRWGYSLLEHLPELTMKTGDWRRTRHNYNELINELFVERWCKPYADYCEKNNLEMTGHYWEHGWPGSRSVPDNMAASIWQQRPGIDMLVNIYDQNSPNAQFGNVRAVKELASAANQGGRKRTLCETFGASGWSTRFEDFKRYVDWTIVLGINTVDEHYSITTLRGARKYDHPPFFSYQTPWWKDYHVLAHYYTRLCAALSSGKQINHILLLEPTTTTWMYQNTQEIGGYGNAFQSLVTQLELAQAECDLTSESIVRHFGRRGKSGLLTIGERQYDLVILPPKTENLDHETVELLKTYLETGGKVLCCDVPPMRVNGKPSEEIKELSASPNWKKVSVEQAIQAAVARTAESGLAIHRVEGDQGILFHHRRRLDDGDLVLLVNTSIDHPTSATLTADARSTQAWDAFNGKVCAYPCTVEGETLTTNIELPPCGSLLLFLSDKKDGNEPPCEMVTDLSQAKQLTPITPITAKRLGPNVLTFDFVDVTAGGETKKGMAVVDAQNWAFEKNGYRRNPWQHAIQPHQKHMEHKFPADSGFTATYHFTIDGKVPEPLEIVIERADLYSITCNGKTVSASPGRWWLDRSFGVVNLSKTAKSGPNDVSITMRPMSPFGEVANAYLLGDFSLEPSQAGFIVKTAHPIVAPAETTSAAPAEKTKTTLSWKSQGMPFYAEGVAYEQTFEVSPTATSAAAQKNRYFVELPSWYGSVARVMVNGKPVGHITHRPWQCEVTPLIQPGKNVIRVEIVGTLANTLGPHHTSGGWVGPFSFGGCPQGPPAGEKYRFLDYGLFGPINLKQTAKK